MFSVCSFSSLSYIALIRDADFREKGVCMKAVLFGFFLLAAGNASASCELVSAPCSTDSSGNTYIREQNLGGGYNTYRNGDLYSQTHQQLNGSYRETYSSGGYRTYYSDPNRSDPYRNNARGMADH
jgi:hypothetical protein